ncbi:MAG: cytochrome c [Gemmatimonadota bacterium]|nr:cytochrome c [Gemmatimonadota bacterium]
MARTSLVPGALMTLAFLAACSSGTQAPAESPEPAPAEEPAETAAADPAPEEETDEEPTTLDGVYTVAQAERGEEVYEELCSECHDSEDWTEGAFLGRWADQSTFQLWYYINDRMPYDNPWSLSRQQVTDVLTYILHLNDLPTGEDELGTTDDDIDQYWIVWDRQ